MNNNPFSDEYLAHIIENRGYTEEIVHQEILKLKDMITNNEATTRAYIKEMALLMELRYFYYPRHNNN